VTTQPEALTAAAGTLQGIGSAMSSQDAATAAPTRSYAATEAANAIAAGSVFGG